MTHGNYIVQHKANLEVVDGTNNISCNSMHRDFIKCLKKRDYTVLILECLIDIIDAVRWL